jgi:hypothetical protein
MYSINGQSNLKRGKEFLFFVIVVKCSINNNGEKERTVLANMDRFLFGWDL